MNNCHQLIILKLYLGVIIFIPYTEFWTQEVARSQCEADSSVADASTRFITLPRPKNLDENNFYHYIFFLYNSNAKENDRYWLDISEELPATDPRKWVYGDGTPVTWTNWKGGEPNDHGDGEPFVEVDPNRLWNDVKKDTTHMFMCVYYLPPGAEDTCPWLSKYVIR